MRKRWLTTVILAITTIFIFTQAAFAFSDIKGNFAEKEILDLKERGIIKGYADGTFVPDGNVTYATGVALIVRSLDLNIDHMRFIKEPKASDYYTNVVDDKWYSDAFIYAQFNGIELPKDVNPDEKLTKEQFAHMLFTAMTTKYEMAFIELWIMIDDEADITPEYMNSIQKLLISKIAELEDGEFNPKKEITRTEAAVMLQRTVLFVEEFMKNMN